MQTKSINDFRVVGPVASGGFIIHDKDNNVFDGNCMRGFGGAAEYGTFQEAYLALKSFLENLSE